MCLIERVGFRQNVFKGWLNFTFFNVFVDSKKIEKTQKQGV